MDSPNSLWFVFTVKQRWFKNRNSKTTLTTQSLNCLWGVSESSVEKQKEHMEKSYSTSTKTEFINNTFRVVPISGSLRRWRSISFSFCWEGTQQWGQTCCVSPCTPGTLTEHLRAFCDKWWSLLSQQSRTCFVNLINPSKDLPIVLYSRSLQIPTWSIQGLFSEPLCKVL